MFAQGFSILSVKLKRKSFVSYDVTTNKICKSAIICLHEGKPNVIKIM